MFAVAVVYKCRTLKYQDKQTFITVLHSVFQILTITVGQKTTVPFVSYSLPWIFCSLCSSYWMLEGFMNPLGMATLPVHHFGQDCHIWQLLNGWTLNFADIHSPRRMNPIHSGGMFDGTPSCINFTFRTQTQKMAEGTNHMLRTGK